MFVRNKSQRSGSNSIQVIEKINGQSKVIKTTMLMKLHQIIAPLFDDTH